MSKESNTLCRTFTSAVPSTIVTKPLEQTEQNSSLVVEKHTRYVLPAQGVTNDPSDPQRIFDALVTVPDLPANVIYACLENLLVYDAEGNLLLQSYTQDDGVSSTTFPLLGSLVFSLNSFLNGVGIGGIQNKIINANAESFAAIWDSFNCFCLATPYEIRVFFAIPPRDPTVLPTPIPLITLGRVEFDLRLGTRSFEVQEQLKAKTDKCDQCDPLCGSFKALPACEADEPRILTIGRQHRDSLVIQGFSTAGQPGSRASTAVSWSVDLCKCAENLLPNAWSLLLHIYIRNFDDDASNPIAIDSALLQSDRGLSSAVYVLRSRRGFTMTLGLGVQSLLSKVQPNSSTLEVVQAANNFQFQLDGKSTFTLTLFPAPQQNQPPAPLEVDVLWNLAAVARVCPDPLEPEP